MTVNSFEELEIWSKARDLSKRICQLTRDGNFSRDFALRNQIRRSTGSIMDNIAEGFERDGNREFIQFLTIAKGSAGEARSQVYRALDYEYITNECFSSLKADFLQLSRQIDALIRYLKSSDHQGKKFKGRGPAKPET